MKRTSLKVLISASIILAMIPFSFLQVKAENPDQVYNLNSLTSYVIGNGEVYYYYDLVFTSDVLCSGQFTLKYKTNSTSANWAMNDGYGIIGSSSTQAEIGGAYWRTIVVEFVNTNYFVFRLEMRGSTSIFTQSVLHQPAGTFAWSTNMDNISLSLAEDENVILYEMSEVQQSILTYVRLLYTRGLTVDLSDIITLLEDTNTNQETMISLLTEIRDGNQSSSSSSTASEQTTTDLQTATDDYNEIETDLSSDFTTNLQGIDTNTWTTRLTGWSSGINWLKTQMNNMFTSMGDYKYMLEIGMILAIALIFIGR